jgi:WD40 repeat protein
MGVVLLGSINTHSQPYQWPDIPGLIWQSQLTGKMSSDMNPEGSIVAVGCDNNTIYIQDSRTGEILNELTEKEQYVRELTFSRDGEWLLSADGRNLTVRNTSDWSVVKTIDFNPEGNPLLGLSTRDVEVTGDKSHILVATGNKGFILIDTETWEQRIWDESVAIDKYGNKAAVDHASFSADDRYFSISIDNRWVMTIIFDTETMEEMMRFPNIPYAEFSPKDKDLLMLKGRTDIQDGENDLRYITMYDFDKNEVREIMNPYDVSIPTSRFSNEGNYLVHTYSYLSIWDINERTDFKSIHFLVSGALWTYNELRGLINLGGSGVLDMNIVSVDEETISGISAYPNPVNEGVTTISSNTPFNSIEIVDTRGGIVLVEQFESPLTEVELDLSSLSPGSYTARIISDSGIASHSLVKE